MTPHDDATGHEPGVADHGAIVGAAVEHFALGHTWRIDDTLVGGVNLAGR